MDLLSGTASDGVQQGMPAIADLDVQARLGFLRKTYGLFTASLMVAAVGAGAGALVLPGIGRAGLGLFLVYLLGFFAVYALRKVPVVNVLALFALTFMSGLLTAPLLLHTLAAKGLTVGVANILTAFLGTTIAFGGLTAYVFTSRKDFSYLGGILSIGLFGLIGFFLCMLLLPMFGVSFAGSPALWFGVNLFGLVLMGGFVLYDTSMILHHYSEDEYVMAALALFLDFILIFKYLLRLLNSRD